MSAMTLFQFAVVKHPTEDEQKKGAKSEIIVPPSEWLLARSEQDVLVLAGTRIPAAEMQFADRLEVAVRPF